MHLAASRCDSWCGSLWNPSGPFQAATQATLIQHSTSHTTSWPNRGSKWPKRRAKNSATSSVTSATAQLSTPGSWYQLVRHSGIAHFRPYQNRIIPPGPTRCGKCNMSCDESVVKAIEAPHGPHFKHDFDKLSFLKRQPLLAEQLRNGPEAELRM